MNDQHVILHATTVAVAGKAVLITGRSGSGKSSLALQLMALGARLVSDDRTVVQRVEDEVIAAAPDTIAGKIEARGVGILSVASIGPTPLSLVVDLEHKETQRLPVAHRHTVLGVGLPCLHNPDSAHFPSSILLYMQSEQQE